ncbi:MAG: hypothetical protein WDN69_04110 [Aliidongia sp.]
MLGWVVFRAEGFDTAARMFAAMAGTPGGFRRLLAQSRNLGRAGRFGRDRDARAEQPDDPAGRLRLVALAAERGLGGSDGPRLPAGARPDVRCQPFLYYRF